MFLDKEQSRCSVNVSVIIIFMVATQSRALMWKLVSFVNIMSQDKSATVWDEVRTDMKVISLFPESPAQAVVASHSGSRVGRFALVWSASKHV